MHATDKAGHIAIACIAALALTGVVTVSRSSATELTTSATASAPTVVGIYFDTAATQTVSVCNGGADEYYTAYILILNATHMAGGSAYKLALDPRIQLISANYPYGIQRGAPLTGIEVAFADCYPIGSPVLVSTLTLWAGNNLIDNAEMRIDPYPPRGVVEFADCQGVIYHVDGGSAFLTIPISAEAMTWGAIKDLYGS